MKESFITKGDNGREYQRLIMSNDSTVDNDYSTVINTSICTVMINLVFNYIVIIFEYLVMMHTSTTAVVVMD